MQLSARKQYLIDLLRDTQKARSDILEQELPESLMEDLEPWLFGKKCLIGPLVKCISTGPSDIDVMNFASLARNSNALHLVGIFSKRKDPLPEDIY